MTRPPAPGQGCDRVSELIVCPYAFWGLNRTISRTVRWDGPAAPPDGAGATTEFSVLYASTKIADVGAHAPLPGDQVMAAAKKAFSAVKRVSTWKTWRKEIERRRPRLLVILGHAVVTGLDANVFIGENSSIAGVDFTGADLRISLGPKPLVLLIACRSRPSATPSAPSRACSPPRAPAPSSARWRPSPGRAGATAAVHLLEAYHEAAGTEASVGDMVAAARRSLLAEKRLMGLILVSHGEIDTKVKVES